MVDRKTRGKAKCPIKRPTNAFGQFFKHMTLAKCGEDMKAVGERWRSGRMTEGVRDHCVAEAEKEMKIYKTKKCQYDRARPKRPLNGYQLFVKDYLKNAPTSSGKTMKEKFSDAAGKWRSLESGEKDKWRNSTVGHNNSSNKKTASGRKPQGARNRKGKPQGARNRKGKSQGPRNRKGRPLGAKNRKGKSLKAKTRKGKSLRAKTRKGKSTRTKNRKGKSLRARNKGGKSRSRGRPGKSG